MENKRRFVAFLTTKGSLVYKFYDGTTDNSHRALVEALQDELEHPESIDKYLNYNARFCGFYTDVYGNGNNHHKIFYGMSSDYCHLAWAMDGDQQDEYVDPREIAKMLVEKFTTSAVDTAVAIFEDAFNGIMDIIKPE